MLQSASDLSGLETEAETKCYHQCPTCLDLTQMLERNVALSMRHFWTRHRGCDKLVPLWSDLSGFDTEAETKCYYQYPTCLDLPQRLRKNVTICIRLVWTWNRGWDKMLPSVSDLSRLDTDAGAKCCLEYATLLDSTQRLRQIGTIMIRLVWIWHRGRDKMLPLVSDLPGLAKKAETKCYHQQPPCPDKCYLQ